MTRRCLLFFACLVLLAGGPVSGQTADEPDLKAFVGWWIGTGRIGFRGGQSEVIKCRATYKQGDRANRLEQNIRCATTSGTVEIASRLKLENGKLSGTWKERKYDLGGNLTGSAVPGGFRVRVAGSDVDATMTVIVRDGKQVVEVHFNNASIIGLTVMMSRG